MTESPESSDLLDLSHYSESTQRHIVALGLIAVLSAQVEERTRVMLAFLLGMHHRYQIEALVLGERFQSLAQKVVAVADTNLPAGYLSDPIRKRRLVEWVRQARPVMERRDALIHRRIGDGPLAGTDELWPSRRSQVSEPLKAQGVELVKDLRRILNDLDQIF